MKCPCKGCISLAICINLDETRCDQLRNYIGRGIIETSKALKVLKSKAFRLWVHANRRDVRIQYVRDDKDFKHIIKDHITLEYSMRPFVKKRYLIVCYGGKYGFLVLIVVAVILDDMFNKIRGLLS